MTAIVLTVSGRLALLGAAFSALSCPMRSNEVAIRFVSADYTIESGQMVVFVPEPGLAGASVLGVGLLSPGAPAKEATPLVISDSVSSKAVFPHAGRYSATVHGLKVLRIRDQRSFPVPLFALRDFNVTEGDLQRGTLEISIASAKLIRVRALDRSGRQQPRRRVAVFNKSVRFSFELPTDSQGEAYVLGVPDEYSFSVLPGQAPGLTIEVSSD